MISCKHTNSEHVDFRRLVQMLDAELKIRDGEEHAFYAQYNKIDKLSHVVVAYHNGTPVGCGALKKFSSETVELKRMFVLSERRGKGFATIILKALESWAGELGFKSCILETGLQQPEAIALYRKNAYQTIPNFGQYKGVQNSVCFQKALNSQEEPVR